jgi:hypothetical protein
MKWIPKIASLIVLWGAIGWVVIYIEPQLLKDIFIPGMYIPFYLLLLLAIWYSVSLIMRKILASFIFSIIIVGSLMLSMYKIMHIGLAIVILLTLVIESVYIYRHNEKNSKLDEQQNRKPSI